jgi:hypothetical protein
MDVDKNVNLNIHLKIECEEVEWISLAQDSVLLSW